MAHQGQRRQRMSDGLTKRNRFIEILKAQEAAAAPIQSHTQGLASLLRAGLSGYSQFKDDKDRTAAADAFRTGMAGGGGYQGGIDALAGDAFSGNEYAGQYQDHYAPLLEDRRYKEEQRRAAAGRVAGAAARKKAEAQARNDAILESLGLNGTPNQPSRGDEMYPTGSITPQQPLAYNQPMQPLGSPQMALPELQSGTDLSFGNLTPSTPVPVQQNNIPDNLRAAMMLPGADVGQIYSNYLLNPPDPVEKFEDVHDVYGQGGYGQRNTVTDELTGYTVPSPSASEAKILRLMEGGLDRNTAIGLESGRYAVSRHPTTQEVQIVDKATGQLVQATDPPPPPAVTPSMPENVDFSDATGVSGAISNLSNTVSDAFNLGLVDPNNERATQAMQNLAVQTQIALADGVAGRPSNYLLEQFSRLTTAPNSIWQGRGRTRERLNQTRDMISGAIRENQAILTSQVNPKTKSDAAQAISRLRTLMSNYDVVIESFGSRQNGTGTTSGGIQWRIVE